jgi:hypothetical protein
MNWLGLGRVFWDNCFRFFKLVLGRVRYWVRVTGPGQVNFLGSTCVACGSVMRIGWVLIVGLASKGE